MNCLKCGKEASESHAFCADCLESMGNCPIDPSTPVLIPSRPASGPEKAMRRKNTTYSSTIRSLQLVIRRLTWAVVLLGLLVCLLTGILINKELGNTPEESGDNHYTTADTNAQT